MRKAGILVSAALSLCGSILYFRSESAFHRQGHDPYQIAADQARLGPVRAVIPEDAIVGYLTDHEPGSVEASAAFKVAQFNLAPRLLEMGAHRQVVLGEFTRPNDFERIARPLGLRVERDFGNGVVLFRSELSR